MDRMVPPEFEDTVAVYKSVLTVKVFSGIFVFEIKTGAFSIVGSGVVCFLVYVIFVVSCDVTLGSGGGAKVSI